MEKKIENICFCEDTKIVGLVLLWQIDMQRLLVVSIVWSTTEHTNAFIKRECYVNANLSLG